MDRAGLVIVLLVAIALVHVLGTDKLRRAWAALWSSPASIPATSTAYRGNRPQ